MARISELDLPDRLAPSLPRWVTSVAVGVLATLIALLLRSLLNALVPGTAVYPLVYPAIMVATLFARWQAGATTAITAIGYSFYYISPNRTAIHTDSWTRAVTTGSVILAAGVTILLAEQFRRAVRRANQERDREIAERDLFLAEFEHRVRNNFMLVASLLEMQRRRAGAGETEQALAGAQARVESIARAHRHLYRGASTADRVDMAAYLAELCEALAEALFLRGAITLHCEADHAALPRDRAVSIGLVVNELVTNAAKHAFGDRDSGTIRVGFREAAPGWVLSVTDDGTGMADAPKPAREGGLGRRLIDAFARQAGGTLATDTGPNGTRVTLALDA